MKRRGFLKAFLGAAVGAGLVAAVPGILQPEVVTLTPSPLFHGWVGTSSEGSCGAITFDMLEKAYKEMSLGRVRPDMIVIGRTTYNHMIKLFGHENYSLAPLKPTWI